jgi:hypothetical protein
MTKLLEQAFEVVRVLPSETQDGIARMRLQLAGDDVFVVELTAAEDASFVESIDQADRGEFASDDEIRAVWAKHGL